MASKKRNDYSVKRQAPDWNREYSGTWYVSSNKSLKKPVTHKMKPKIDLPIGAKISMGLGGRFVQRDLPGIINEIAGYRKAFTKVSVPKGKKK